MLMWNFFCLWKACVSLSFFSYMCVMSRNSFAFQFWKYVFFDSGCWYELHYEISNNFHWTFDYLKRFWSMILSGTTVLTNRQGLFNTFVADFNFNQSFFNFQSFDTQVVGHVSKPSYSFRDDWRWVLVIWTFTWRCIYTGNRCVDHRM